jgi:hypothetical protein
MVKIKKVKYFTYDMAGTPKYFKTKKEADEWRKFHRDRMAINLKIYKVV